MTADLTEQQDKKPNILVVEDDINSQKLVSFYIRGHYSPVFATSVEGAKRMLTQNSVDLVLLDLSLDGNEDGLNLVRYMKLTDQYSGIPVIATTAHAFLSDRDKCLNSGCNDYLAKPISRDQLLDKIKEYLR